LLFDQGDKALTDYQNAFAFLQQNDIDEATLQVLFMRPVFIPRPQLDISLPASNTETEAPIVFNAWSAVFPGVYQPLLAGDSLVPVTNYTVIAQIDLAFNRDPMLSTLSSAGFRYIVQDPLIESVMPDNDAAKRVASEQIRHLQFRPLLLDGEVQRGKGIRLRYDFAADINLLPF